ncbi:MAG: [FeFe] hydrogenase H-cluster maturation GTPase HydF [Ruminococcus sp.]|nr:[FeFe] hydrogenase H-cluster maturation GTPase HydF [Ruminococcus sp.]
MGLNDIPSGERVHIGFFGRRNAGKSSIVNAVTNQGLSLVSDVAGTTTDPVYKAMELLPIGPVVIIDTAGYDDEGILGEMRVKSTRQALNRTDIAVLVVDATLGMGECEKELTELFAQKQIPYIVAVNKTDIAGADMQDDRSVLVSAKTGEGIFELKEKLGALAKLPARDVRLIGDKLQRNDLVVLVVPIDESAPKGRLILPQQQTIRDILDADACAVVVKDTELADTIAALGKKPRLVITDSQAFASANKQTPHDIMLTSFSILMARYKGFLDTAVEGAVAIDRLKDGDKVLISEGCTHHRQCGDIGTVKIPNWLKKHTGKNVEIHTTSGREFPEDLSPYALVIHCGGCMLTPKEMTYRMKCALDQGVAFTNYGVAIAHMTGILKRSVEIFPHLYEKL